MLTLRHFPYARGDVLENMAADAVLFDLCRELGWVGVRFYGWRAPAITFGYSQRFATLPDAHSSLPRIRRLTGGGVVEHGPDLTYALALPKHCAWSSMLAQDAYRHLHDTIAATLKDAGEEVCLAPCPGECAPSKTTASICFSAPQLHDVLGRDGKKIAGAAMRRSQHGLLIQGSLHLPSSISREHFATGFTDRLQTTLSLHAAPGAALPQDRLPNWIAHFADPAWNQRH